MAKFYDVVGYGEQVESPPGSGVYKDVIIERKLRGDVIRRARQLQEGDQLNKNITVTNSISVVADNYASRHIFAIRYVKWQGARWEVTEVTEERPRLILRLGGVYNGPTPS